MRKFALFFLLSFLIIQNCHSQQSASYVDQQVITGAARTQLYLPLLKNKRVALLVNQTATIGHTHLVDSLLSLHINVVKIFGPEHGFRGNADAGAHVNNSRDAKTGIPVVSLYGTHSKPSPEDLKDVDIMIYDIQDVGTRFYTFISSMQKFMEAAADNHKPLIILDRPNPNGFYVDGPVLDTAFRSFVGMQPIPVVYGMTIGEYAKMLKGEHWLNTKRPLNLTVIKCLHYNHNTKYHLPIKPSPNLPNMTSVYLYPSLCLFEGTTFSVGRGTDKPFQQFGHPKLPHDLYSFTPRSMLGATNPPWKDKTCYGFDLSQGNTLKAVNGQFQLKWIMEAYRLMPDKDQFFNHYFNKLAGTDKLMQQIKDGESEAQIRRSWQPALKKFKKIRKKYLLYPDF